MDVDLYVYDLSKGLARQLSLSLTGIHIDAIYHTSLVFGGIEYFFGQGVHRAKPGGTHHGQPMKIIHQGKTELPMPVIEEYMQSLAEIYTAESYDLFLHNCNNFTQDLSMFLVGKEIPEEIRTLPDKFLSTPFGQMMKPQIDAALRGVTQAPVVDTHQAVPPVPTQNAASASAPTSNGAAANYTDTARVSASPSISKYPSGVVLNVSSLSQVEELLGFAKSSCAVIFFTSSTCAPCKIVYPAYDELAEEAGSKAVLIKVDINGAYDVAQRYQVRATPTFMSFSKGKKMDTWSGANERQLRSNVRLLLETTYPPHPHTLLRLPNFQANKHPVLYKKTPPLDKLAGKIGPLAQSPPLSSLLSFCKSRFATNEPAASTPLPSDLSGLPSFVAANLSNIPRDSHFALIDLLRVSFIDARVSGFFAAEDPSHVLLLSILSPISQSLSSSKPLPYNLHICTLQLLCNLFTTHLYLPSLHDPTSTLSETVLTITTSSLLSQHPTLIHTSAALSFNLSTSLHNTRFHLQQNPNSSSSSSSQSLGPCISTESQISLTASLLESLQTFSTTSSSSPSTSSPTTTTSRKDLLSALLLSLGILLYGADPSSEIPDLCKAMGARETIQHIAGTNKEFASLPVLKDVLLMLE